MLRNTTSPPDWQSPLLAALLAKLEPAVKLANLSKFPVFLPPIFVSHVLTRETGDCSRFGAPRPFESVSKLGALLLVRISHFSGARTFLSAGGVDQHAKADKNVRAPSAPLARSEKCEMRISSS